MRYQAGPLHTTSCNFLASYDSIFLEQSGFLAPQKGRADKSAVRHVAKACIFLLSQSSGNHP